MLSQPTNAREEYSILNLIVQGMLGSFGYETALKLINKMVFTTSAFEVKKLALNLTTSKVMLSDHKTADFLHVLIMLDACGYVIICFNFSGS